ncbi:MAG: LutB/LldF family L-lactate oxidation iron-sulfur protein [Planctomycetota bacterium]|jgi:L-lactate dehydrogenase complex protein LldF|nr:LutB/LldF family L-lactate oxidation iron-sulfur protein [Planctomycetota bacterium]MDP6763432.1 LutB/LldF family L-lactate oxidation iron-sulfur protein [Planctomycetota bacterium]MDP6988596.1 LutB/LldF family L-lactate oxidation iron-sulfur protein [Planctomycetota bacterium]
MTHLHPERFGENARAALGDEVLRGALRKATGLFGRQRGAAVAEMPEWEALRERARAVKAEALASLDVQLERFEERATANGIQVRWARDATEACEQVKAIAERLGRPTIVKSKSMATEEIRLNEHLEQAGHRPVETDLGEWIIQLAGETPSHIIAPAIHKTKRQVGELFAEKLGIPRSEDERELTRAARRALRHSFATAELGITGANFAIAETGSILLIENEGNIRLATSMPRVLVALVGIEKVIPRLCDLQVFLRLLPRSGTGQRLTSYQSLISGPRAGSGDEGPEEMIVILLDNGRSSVLADNSLRESLACIRCGACLNACPVYRQIGGHAYGSVYAGPIGSVITPGLQGLEKTAELPFASSLCGACREVCPVKIDLPALLTRLRADVVEGRAPGQGQRPRRPRRIEKAAFAFWRWLASDPVRWTLSMRVARLAQRAGLDRLLPPARAWRKGRALRPFAPRSFRERWKEDDRRGR